MAKVPGRTAAGGRRAVVALLDRSQPGTLRDSLERLGFEVETAWTGAEVVVRYAAAPFDLVVVEDGLPDAEAAPLVRMLRHLGFAGHAVIVGQPGAGPLAVEEDPRVLRLARGGSRSDPIAALSSAPAPAAPLDEVAAAPAVAPPPASAAFPLRPDLRARLGGVAQRALGRLPPDAESLVALDHLLRAGKPSAPEVVACLGRRPAVGAAVLAAVRAGTPSGQSPPITLVAAVDGLTPGALLRLAAAGAFGEVPGIHGEKWIAAATEARARLRAAAVLAGWLAGAEGGDGDAAFVLATWAASGRQALVRALWNAAQAEPLFARIEAADLGRFLDQHEALVAEERLRRWSRDPQAAPMAALLRGSPPGTPLPDGSLPAAWALALTDPRFVGPGGAPVPEGRPALLALGLDSSRLGGALALVPAVWEAARSGDPGWARARPEG